MGRINVIQPGLLTTIQDFGRWGFQSIGMSVAGVMDDYAAHVGNILLGNDENTPVLEITLLGPGLRFQNETDIVITGGDLQPRLNTQSINLWTVYKVQQHDTLNFAGARSGCRTYLAVAGGFAVKRVMGSASTYLRGKLGGYEGRALKAGDILHTGEPPQNPVPINFSLPSEYQPEYCDRIRVIMGPQDEDFTAKGIETFLSSEYTVTNEADRMGYRLDGPKIEHKSGADIISDGIALGAIQVPAHGTPIIMLADRQTTGGYTKIANVISVDIPSVAQKKPGDRLTFEKVAIEEAQVLYRERKQRLEQLRQLVQKASPKLSEKVTSYRVVINGQRYEVSIRAIQPSE